METRTRLNIYVGHSRSFEFEKELYEPIRKSKLYSLHNVALPHEFSDAPFHSKQFLMDCNLFIVESSYPSTGLGIEVGWGDILGVPIVCIHRKGTQPSSSLKVVTNTFIEYTDTLDLIEKLNNLKIR